MSFYPIQLQSNSEVLASYFNSFCQSPYHQLADLEKQATASKFPIIGRQTGRVLQHYAALLKARSVFEMGSGFGYSALWFAAGMHPEGEISCTDFSAKNLQQIESLWREIGLLQKINCHAGDAIATIEKSAGIFDIVFVDVDKHLYVQAFEAAWPRIRDGGLLIVDNILWKGSVLRPPAGDTATESIQLLTRMVFNRTDTNPLLLPVDDGILIVEKNPRRA